MRYKVVILPGGGVFGMVTAQFLAGYDRNACVQEFAKVVGATSVGGILACLYGVGMDFGTVRDAMKENLPKVFAKSWYNIYGLLGPLHDASILEGFLQKYLDPRLAFGDLEPNLVITSIDFQHHKIKVFDNITKRDDVKLPAWNIARATTAAPTYFKPFDCQSTAYIDGGLFENIPLMTTIMAVKSKMGIPPEKLDIFVIGTGRFPDDGEDIKSMAHWGLRSWAGPMIDSLTSSNEMASVFWAQHCGVKSLTVFNPVQLEQGWKMNDPSLVDKLINLASSHQIEFNQKFGEWVKRT